MHTLHLTSYLIITVLTRAMGVMLLPYTQRFNKKLPTAIYLFTSLFSYYALSTYIAYLDFALIFITVAGACLCINMVWNAITGNLRLTGLSLLGAGLVLTGGLLSIAF